jgi:hypothetical protein
MEAPETRAALVRIHTDPLFLEGEDLRALLDRKEREIAAVAQRPQQQLPNFPGWALAATLLAAVASALSLRRSRPVSTDFQPQTALAIQTLALTALYIVAFEAAWPGYRAATALYVVALGWLLARRERISYAALAAIAAVMSFGLHYLFTNVFVIDLP